MSTKRQLRTESYMKQNVLKATKGIMHNADYRSIPKYQEKAESKTTRTSIRNKKKKGDAAKHVRIQHIIWIKAGAPNEQKYPLNSQLRAAKSCQGKYKTVLRITKRQRDEQYNASLISRCQTNFMF